MSNPLRVLIVEDMEKDADLLLRALRESGYEPSSRRVYTREAMRLALTDQSWDAILCDYNMPRFTPMEALLLLRSLNLDLPFIVVSASVGEETAVAAMKAGAHDYLMKGNLTRLGPVIEREMRDAEVRRERTRTREALRETEEHCRLVAETATDAILSIDEDSKILFVNGAAEGIFGYTREEMLGRKMARLIPERHRQAHGDSLRRYLETGLRQIPWKTVELPGLRKDGQEIPLELSFGEYTREGKRIFIAFARDITDRKLADEALRESQRAMATLISNLPGIAYRCRNDRDWTLEFVSAGCQELTGYLPSDLIGNHTLSYAQLIHPDDREAVWKDVQSALAKNEPFRMIYRIISAGGKEKWVWEQGRGVFSGKEELVALEGFIVDITERKHAEEALEYRVLHDHLTDLPNRTLVHDRLRQAILVAEREKKPLALLLMDLNRFKSINDTLGHDHGDLLLKQLGPRMVEVLRASDTVARMGGDEFAILLPSSDMEGATVAARKILEALSRPFHVAEFTLEVGASIGIAMFPEHGDDIETLMRRADVAMYSAKKSGSGYAVYVTEHDRYNPGGRALIDDLRRSIDGGELVLLYQPRKNLRKKGMSCIEALVRWNHPSKGLLLPGQFISMAEHTGFIKALTDWVLDQVFRQCRDWEAMGIRIPVVVNLAARNLLDPKLPSRIIEGLRAHGVPPERLAVEVTENAIMSDPERAAEVMGQLKAMGIRSVIDEFGSGYSSLGRLKRLPIDAVVIDQSFVGAVASDPDNAAVVRSMVDLAHDLGLRAEAQGVESRIILDRLTELGCDAAQGFHISRPLRPAEIAGWLAEFGTDSTPTRRSPKRSTPGPDKGRRRKR
ncbi:MAG TPA: EAL domain-containing protein [Nitrospiria bacterium]